MSLLAGLTKLDVFVFEIADLTDGSSAIEADKAYFAGGEPYLRHAVFLCHELSGCAGGTNELSASAGVKFDRVHDRTDRDLSDRENVAGFDVGVFARVEERADRYSVGSDSIALLAVFILEKHDISGTVGIVFDRNDLACRILICTLEVDDPVFLFVAAALVANGDSARVVSARMLFKYGYKGVFGWVYKS